MNLTPYLNPYILGSMLVAILFLLVLYIFNYQLPAISLQFKTQKINNSLRKLAQNPVGTVNPTELEELFLDRPFNRLWNEFKNSLHEMSSEDGTDKSVRSTLTADFYFSKEAIVDSYINVEFFKHLPGMLTGIGIIGTFTGLIWGLRQFNTNNAVETLNLLLGEVSSAFLGSGIAIFVAILITFFEKQTLNSCYKRLDETAKLLDSLYKAGVGEDYLARLVKATETSARNSIDFKQVLIENLEVMMEKQSQVIGRTIAESLESPIDKLLLIVNKASGDQSDVIKNLVDSLMNTFIAKIDQAFGSQIEAVNQAIFRSTTTMESVEESMRRLLNDIALASQNAVKSMSEQMLETVIQANINQDQKNEALINVIENLHQLNEQHQIKSHAMIDDVMRNVLGSVDQSIAQIVVERTQQSELENERNTQFVQSTNLFLENLQSTLKTSQSDQFDLNLKLKSFVEELNQLSFDYFISSKKAMEEILEKTLQSTQVNMAQLSGARDLQNQQDEERNQRILLSLNEFQSDTQTLLKNSQQEQFQLNSKLKIFVEELNQLTYDAQLKSKEVIDQTLEKVLTSVDQSVAQLTLSQEAQVIVDAKRNEELFSTTRDLHQGISGILSQSMTDQYQLNLKSKEVIDQTLDKVLASVDQSVAQIELSHNAQVIADTRRNEELFSTTRDLHQGISEILDHSMKDQYQLNLKLKDLVADLNQISLTHLTQAKELMHSSTQEVLNKLENGIQVIANDRTQQIQSDEKRAVDLNESMTQLNNRISEQVKKMLAEFIRVSELSQNHILAIEKSSMNAIEGMNNGASTMNSAAENFSASGNIVIRAFEQSKAITEQMETIGEKMQFMITNTHDLFKQFEQSSAAHQGYLKELTLLIANAKKESGVSSQIVQDMESALRALNQSEQLSKEYLGNINQVLKEAFSQFNTQMMAQVTSLNQENDRLLGSSINALTSAVEQIVHTTTKLTQN